VLAGNVKGTMVVFREVNARTLILVLVIRVTPITTVLVVRIVVVCPTVTMPNCNVALVIVKRGLVFNIVKICLLVLVVTVIGCAKAATAKVILLELDRAPLKTATGD
jgi:hypothetical protein